MDRNGEFQLEFTLSNIRSIFEHKFRINQSIFNNTPKYGKMETSYFSFAGYDWSSAVYPAGKSDSQIGNLELYTSYIFYRFQTGLNSGKWIAEGLGLSIFIN